ncbi:MAG: MFS transporter [Haloferacaceae archaeon]
MTAQTTDAGVPAAPGAPDDADDSTRPAWATAALVGGVSLVSTALAAYEIVPASVTPLTSDALGVGPAAAGFVVGITFGAVVVGSLPAGAVLDRTNSRTALPLAVLALVVAGAWGWVGGRRGDYGSVLASRALGGLASAVVWNAGIDVVSRAASDANRATAVGVFTASGPVGFALGQSTGPFVALRFGWPAIFPAFTGIALLGLLAFWPTSRGLGASSVGAPTRAEFGAVLRNGTVWSIAVLGFLGYVLYLFVNSWGSSYLTDAVGLSLAQSGLLVAVFPAVGVVARISSGILSDRVFGGRRRPIVLGSFALAAPVLLVFTRLASVPLLVAALLLAGFVVQLTLGLSFTYVREVVDVRVAATAVAFHTSVGLAGAFVAPIAGGSVVELAGFDAAFLLAAVLAVCGVGVAWRVPEPTRSDTDSTAERG